MIAPSAPASRAPFALLSLRLLALQIGLALIVFVLFVLWLRIPDATAPQLLLSAALALGTLALATGGESALFLRLAERTLSTGRVLRGALLLLGAAIVWSLLYALLAHLATQDALYAGYLNSRAPRSLRPVLSFTHLYTVLDFTWTALAFISATLLGTLALLSLASPRPAQALGRALRSPLFWLLVLVGPPLAGLLTTLLFQWVPGHSLRAEALSLALRLIAAILLNALLLSALLALAASIVRSTAPTHAEPDPPRR